MAVPDEPNAAATTQGEQSRVPLHGAASDSVRNSPKISPAPMAQTTTTEIFRSLDEEATGAGRKRLIGDAVGSFDVNRIIEDVLNRPHTSVSTGDGSPSNKAAAIHIVFQTNNNIQQETYDTRNTIGTVNGNSGFGPGSNIYAAENATRSKEERVTLGSNDGAGAEWPRSAFLACHKRPDDLALFLATAALDGLSFTDIRSSTVDLAAQLTHLLQERPSTVTGAEPKSAGADESRSEISQPQVRLSTSEDLFGVFRLTSAWEQSATGRSRELLKFRDPGASQQVLNYAFTRLQLGPSWPGLFATFLAALGAEGQTYEVRIAAGRAVGLLWAAGHDKTAQTISDAWFRAEKTTPLAALDACLTTAALGSTELREKFNKRIVHWGHYGEGEDGLFALRRVALGTYWTIEPRACAGALGHLMLMPGIVAFLRALDAMSQLIEATVEKPEDADFIFDAIASSLRGSKTATGQRWEQGVLGIVALLDVEMKGSDGKKQHAIDTLLPTLAKSPIFGAVLNLAMSPSIVQAQAVRAMRDLTLRNLKRPLTGSFGEEPILVVLDKMYRTGTQQDRKRLSHYVAQWISAAEHARAAGARQMSEMTAVWNKMELSA